MNISDKGAVKKGFAGLSRVNHVRISAGTMLNRVTVTNDGSSSRVVTRVGAE